MTMNFHMAAACLQPSNSTAVHGAVSVQRWLRGTLSGTPLEGHVLSWGTSGAHTSLT